MATLLWLAPTLRLGLVADDFLWAVTARTPSWAQLLEPAWGVVVPVGRAWWAALVATVGLGEGPLRAAHAGLVVATALSAYAALRSLGVRDWLAAAVAALVPIAGGGAELLTWMSCDAYLLTVLLACAAVAAQRREAVFLVLLGLAAAAREVGPVLAAAAVLASSHRRSWRAWAVVGLATGARATLREPAVAGLLGRALQAPSRVPLDGLATAGLAFDPRDGVGEPVVAWRAAEALGVPLGLVVVLAFALWLGPGAARRAPLGAALATGLLGALASIPPDAFATRHTWHATVLLLGLFALGAEDALDRRGRGAAVALGGLLAATAALWAASAWAHVDGCLRPRAEVADAVQAAADALLDGGGARSVPSRSCGHPTLALEVARYEAVVRGRPAYLTSRIDGDDEVVAIAP